MAIAFICLNLKPKEEDALDRIKKIPGVQEAHLVYGVYDVVVKLIADNMESLKQIIFQKLRKLDGITATLTMIVNK